MKTVCVTWLALAPLGLMAQQQTMSVEEFEPKSTLVVPQHHPERAKFPFIDVHMHQTTNFDQLVRDMDKLNMKIMVSSFVRGGTGDRVKKVLEGMKACPGRFALFGNIDYTGIDDPDYPQRAAAQVESDIKAGTRGLKVWKDFGLMLKDKSGKRIPVDDPRFDQVFEVCAKYKVPVLIHTADPKQFWEPVDRYNERWLDLKMHPNRGKVPEATWEQVIGEQHHLFERHPNTIFIDAHMGWLAYDLGRLGALLDRLPNVYVELAATIVELGRQPRSAHAFFTKYQDRVLFGKDTWRPEEYSTYFRTVETADEYFDHERKYQGMWKIYGMDLSDEVLKKFYYKNALKIVPGLSKEGFPQ